MDEQDFEGFRAYVARYVAREDCGCWDDISKLLKEIPSLVVLAWEPSVPDEESGGAILKHPSEEKFWAFEESQDYTGHGCQCGSSLEGPFASLEEAWLFGLGEYGRAVLGKYFPDLPSEKRL